MTIGGSCCGFAIKWVWSYLQLQPLGSSPIAINGRTLLNFPTAKMILMYDMNKKEKKIAMVWNANREESWCVYIKNWIIMCWKSEPYLEDHIREWVNSRVFLCTTLRNFQHQMSGHYLSQVLIAYNLVLPRNLHSC